MCWIMIFGITTQFLQRILAITIVTGSLIQISSAPPAPCKQGKFYEESVFDYFPCSVCNKQSHYSNCDRCCSVTTHQPRPAFPTSPRSPSFTLPAAIPLDVSQRTRGKRTPPTDQGDAFKHEWLLILGGLAVGFCSGLILCGSLVFVIRYCNHYRQRRSINHTSQQARKESQTAQSEAPPSRGATSITSWPAARYSPAESTINLSFGQQHSVDSS